MSGIYIHIPYCKQACHYCDFHFSTNTSRITLMVEMICKELEIRRDYLSEEQPIKTIYFGGGTPSLLSPEQIYKILNRIKDLFLLDLEEITLEANPDDLEFTKFKEYKTLGIERLSIGIQSFDEEILKFYNRAHSADQSHTAVEMAKKAGFEKLSIDLIYGFPSSNHAIWKRDLSLAIEKGPDHISSYCLSIEPRTALGNWADKGLFIPASEEFSAEQFEILQDTMEKAGYIQYEISNFAKPGFFALHNANYWKNVPYLGIGPSAHSFDGKNRGYNVSNNQKYLKAMQQGEVVFQVDKLSEEEIINEYILTSLRTIWGTDLLFLRDTYKMDLLLIKKEKINQLQQGGFLKLMNGKLTISPKGRLLADTIASELFI